MQKIIFNKIFSSVAALPSFKNLINRSMYKKGLLIFWVQDENENTNVITVEVR